MLCFHVDRGQVLVSRQTGQVRPSTHMDGYRVNQELTLPLGSMLPKSLDLQSRDKL
jgi:hypothetical protein